MNVLIIEDESHAADKLERQLLKIDQSINIQAKLDSVGSSVKWLNENHADLIFLDIHLGDSNSFKIFDQIEVKTPIIFTTAYDQYAVEAFKVNSIDYLLKPINQRELEKAIEKYHERFVSNPGVDYSKIADLLYKKEPDYQKRFMVYAGDKIKTIEKDEVAYFMGEGKYCYLYSNDNHQYLINSTLDKLDKVLDPDEFFRINRQFLINIKSIDQMHTYPKGRVKIDLLPSNKKEAIVSIERAGDFKKWLNR
ncbi:MAG: response regulator transcription factor [Cyclobacteriaceae bacterium]|nr:response regulator transcription factor [Cyclobacteriaceae bacterium]